MKPWPFTVLLLLTTAAIYHWREPSRIWLLGPAQATSSTDIQEEASRLVFRRGSLSNPVELASQKLLEQKPLRAHRLADATFNAEVTESVSQEMHSWRRQWEKDEERERRLSWQRMNEPGMEQAIRDTLLDEAWIEKKITDEVQITETELEASFSSQQKHLEIPAASHVAHLFLSGHQPNQKDRTKEIQSIHQRLTEGEKWALLVQKYSEDPRTKNQGGDLGWLAEGRMPSELTTAIRRMKAGDISQPICTHLGWHIVRVLERQPAHLPRLEDVRTELTSAMADQKRITAIDRLVRQLLHRQPGTAF